MPWRMSSRLGFFFYFTGFLGLGSLLFFLFLSFFLHCYGGHSFALNSEFISNPIGGLITQISGGFNEVDEEMVGKDTGSGLFYCEPKLDLIEIGFGYLKPDPTRKIGSGIRSVFRVSGWIGMGSPK